MKLIQSLTDFQTFLHHKVPFYAMFVYQIKVNIISSTHFQCDIIRRGIQGVIMNYPKMLALVTEMQASAYLSFAIDKLQC